jgi:two-component system sensor histidine kinase PilS (NtrC family)
MRWIATPDIWLRSLVVIRVVVTTVLLGSGAIIYFENGLRNEAFFLVLIVASVYLLSLLYLLLTPFFYRHTDLFKGMQIGLDLILASAAIYITGGKSSPFIFLYGLVIIYSGMVLTRTASYIAAAASGVFYLLMELYRLSYDSNDLYISLSGIWGEKGVVYTYFNLSGFLLIAILIGYLADRVRITRKELGESAKNLQILRNLHENILQSLTSGVITLDLHGRIISINKTGLEILEINGEDKVVGNSLSSIMPGIGIEEPISKRREQMLYLTPNGRRLTLGFSSSVLRDEDGEMKGYIIIFQDLTEIKELEDRLRMSEKMALLGRLSAGLAHEIRNPLSAISGAVEVLGEEVKPTEDNLRLVRVVTQEVERLNLLVEDFLLLTTPIQSFTTPVDVGLIITETVESFIRTVRRSGLEIVMDVHKGLYVQADSYRLKQVIWNLLLNSMQAMPNGGRIVIESYLEDDNVAIKVSDNGCGIDQKIMHRIFEPFFTTKNLGTGLGLAIVQKVIEGYNGKIDVISSEGKGTTFVMTLPKAKTVMREEVKH